MTKTYRGRVMVFENSYAEAAYVLSLKCCILARIEQERVRRLSVINRAHWQGRRHFFEVDQSDVLTEFDRRLLHQCQVRF